MKSEQSQLLSEVYEDTDFAVLLQIAGRMISQYVEAIAKEQGFSAGHLSLLGMVARKPGLQQSAYALLLAINDATLARYVDKVEERGLLERVRCHKDRRSARLHLTRDGRLLVQDTLQSLTGVRQNMRARLTEDQIKALHENLLIFLSAEAPDMVGEMT